MEQKFSLAQLTVLNTSPPEIATIAANTGYDYFSMRQIYMGLPGEPDYDLSKNKPLLRETKKVMENTGIKLLDIELARIFDGMDLSKYEPAFQTAAELGGKYVLSSIWTPNRDYYLEKFAGLCDLANQYGLEVELEYVPIASVNNLKDTVDVLNTVNRSNSGIMIDIHHFHRAGDKVENLKKLPKEWFKFAHICDAPAQIPEDREEMTRILREARDYLGDGGIDIKSILDAMPAMPYSIELPNISQVEKFGYEEHARLCLETAKTYLQK